MAPVWNSYAIRPMGFGGIAILCAWVLPGSTASADAILEVRAKVGLVAVTDPADTSAVSVAVPVGQNKEVYAQGLESGPCVVSWFARIESGWVAGPQISADLSSSWVSSFDYIKPWAVRLLQQLEAETAPLTPKKVNVRGAYPRDTFPMPCISVTFEAMPQGQTLLGDIARPVDDTHTEERKPWTVSLTVVLWSETPEERDLLAPWFLRCMQALSYLAPYNNLAEPSYNLTESEDFSGQYLEKPLFIVSGNLSGTMWSSMELPVHNFIGHLTI